MVVQRVRDLACRTRATVALDEELPQERQDQRGVAGAQQPPRRVPVPHRGDRLVVHDQSVGEVTDRVACPGGWPVGAPASIRQRRGDRRRVQGCSAGGVRPVASRSRPGRRRRKSLPVAEAPRLLRGIIDTSVVVEHRETPPRGAGQNDSTTALLPIQKPARRCHTGQIVGPSVDRGVEHGRISRTPEESSRLTKQTTKPAT